MTSSEYDCCGLLDTLLSLPSQGWYYGNITSLEAKRILKDEPNGAFLVHDSTDPNSMTELFIITFKISNRFGSVRVDYANGYFSLSLQYTDVPLFQTLMELVAFCIDVSAVQKRPVCALTCHALQHNILLYLTKPVSRHKQLHSLQFLCRAAIHSVVTQDKLKWLPLPKHLLEHYVTGNPLFDEQLFPSEDKSHTEEDSLGQSSQHSLALDTSNAH